VMLESSVKSRSAAGPGVSSGGIWRRLGTSSGSRVEACGAGVAMDATTAGGAVMLESIEFTAADSCGIICPKIGEIMTVRSGITGGIMTV
jgi:hypothetical protein